MRREVLKRENWVPAARAVLERGGRLVALWGSGRRQSYFVCAAYATPEGLVWAELPLDGGATYPDLSPVFYFAGRMQRAMGDLLGLTAEEALDRRPWLNHGAWPYGYHPLLSNSSGKEVFDDCDVTDYPFVKVEGDGVHEIPVGPVHAGIIEPGHFRFSIVGEKVLRLEERLGYTHKGIEKRFTDLPPEGAHLLAGRVSGDSTVAHAWAYCMALEDAAEVEVPARASWLRGLMLERERVANHLGDLGALGNDAGFAFALTQFSKLREDWQRVSRVVFGHRFMMDRVVPGGVAEDLNETALTLMREDCAAFGEEVKALRVIFEEHAGLQDRFIAAGRVRPELANRLGVTGLVARASGQAVDLRCDHPFGPYEQLEVRMATHRNGDVAARVIVRFEEVLESLRLIEAICENLPRGAIRGEVEIPVGEVYGAGWVEGWRGEVFCGLELAGGKIRRCHVHDPSWQNWPALEHAIMDNIVPDFPLINKSFNLSYSGHDL
ncbi:MAG: nickel-dependent hydrogenase large subunit [Betaproteobacteria bacterium]|nr:nickel-dependent hydrogenase large subunit [Betaproteobacteria bacterium]